MAAPTSRTHARQGVIVVGSGLTFLSGISVYTHQLAHELAADYDVAAILMSKLVPRHLYPGGKRVGAPLSSLSYRDLRHVDLNWYWGLRILEAAHLIRSSRPRAVIFQWWSAATAHTYLALAEVAKSVGAQVILEVHEVQDPGEAGKAPLQIYGRFALRRLLRVADGILIHHEHDVRLLHRVDSMEGKRIALACHPPYGYLTRVHPRRPPELGPVEPGVTTFLLFGVIRPRKGFRTAVGAFQTLPREVAERARLLVVGEVWEGLEDAVADAKVGPNSDRITVIDRYVSDAEAAAAFERADVVLLPYSESSSSGPLALAQAFGLPYLYSDLPSLRVASGDYVDARPVTARDVPAWARAMAAVVSSWRRDCRPPVPSTDDWSAIIDAYGALLRGEVVAA